MADIISEYLKGRSEKNGFSCLYKYLRHIKWEIETEVRNKSIYLSSFWKKISVCSLLVLHKNTEAGKHSTKQKERT